MQSQGVHLQEVGPQAVLTLNHMNLFLNDMNLFLNHMNLFLSYMNLFLNHMYTAPISANYYIVLKFDAKDTSFVLLDLYCNTEFNLRLQ